MERGKKKKKRKKEDAAFSSIKREAIIHLGMKHKLPRTLVAMATIESIADFFGYLPPPPARFFC